MNYLYLLICAGVRNFLGAYFFIFFEGFLIFLKLLFEGSGCNWFLVAKLWDLVFARVVGLTGYFLVATFFGLLLLLGADFDFIWSFYFDFFVSVSFGLLLLLEADCLVFLDDLTSYFLDWTYFGLLLEADCLVNLDYLTSDFLD